VRLLCHKVKDEHNRSEQLRTLLFSESLLYNGNAMFDYFSEDVQEQIKILLNEAVGKLREGVNLLEKRYSRSSHDLSSSSGGTMFDRMRQSSRSPLRLAQWSFRDKKRTETIITEFTDLNRRIHENIKLFILGSSLSVNPELIVADEPVSALDVSVQAQVLNLLIDLQEEYGLAYLFISHDLAVMRHISHRIAVMYLGRIVELTDKRTLFAKPLHPYTEALLSAATAPDPRRRRTKKAIVQGDVPSPANPPSGCHFHTRCPYAVADCKVKDPVLREVAPGHHVACHLR